MRWKRVGLLIMFMIFVAGGGQAHPPGDITIGYDKETKMLHLEMRHTTHDPREDYIRKIVIHVPGKEPVVKRYNIQTNTMNFSTDVAIDAQPGTIVEVEAFSKEGGTQSASFTIPPEEQDPQAAKEQKVDHRPSRMEKKGSGT